MSALQYNLTLNLSSSIRLHFVHYDYNKSTELDRQRRPVRFSALLCDEQLTFPSEGLSQVNSFIQNLAHSGGSVCGKIF